MFIAAEKRVEKKSSMEKNKTHILCAAQFSTGPEVAERLEMKWTETEPCVSTATLGYIARYVIQYHVQNLRQCTCIVIFRCVHETSIAVESNNNYIFVCGCGWVDVGARVRACRLPNPVCHAQAPYRLRFLCLHRIFRHYLINDTIFEKKKKLLNIRCVFWFFIQLSFKTFLILRTTQRDTVINVKTSACEVAVILVGFWRKSNFLDRFSKKSQISNLI